MAVIISLYNWFKFNLVKAKWHKGTDYKAK